MAYRVQSVERGVDILMALAAGPKTVTNIAKETNLAKGTAFRLLATLSYEQVVVREPEGSRYLLGPGVLRLVQEIKSTFGWIGALAGAPLRDLWERTEETVAVHVRNGAQRVCVEELPSPHALRFTASIGATDPIHVGSAGKVLLAFLEPDALDELLPRLRLQAVTEHSIVDRDKLREELELTRERGWATSRGERIAGSASVSVAIQVPGMMLAALSVLGPADRITPEKQEEYGRLAQRTATAIERLVTAKNGKR